MDGNSKDHREVPWFLHLSFSWSTSIGPYRHRCGGWCQQLAALWGESRAVCLGTDGEMRGSSHQTRWEAGGWGYVGKHGKHGKTWKTDQGTFRFLETPFFLGLSGASKMGLLDIVVGMFQRSRCLPKVRNLDGMSEHCKPESLSTFRSIVVQKYLDGKDGFLN